MNAAGFSGSPSGRPSAAGCGRRPRCAGQPGRRCTGWAGWSGKLPCLPEPVLGPVATDGDKENGAARAPFCIGFRPPPAPFAQHLRVEAFITRRHRFPALLARDGQAALGQRGAQFGFRTKPFQRLRQLRAVARILQDQRVLARRQILREAAVGGRADHHRQAMRHGFQRRHAVAVVQRGMGVDVGRAEILGDLGGGFDQGDPVRDGAGAARVRAWLRRPRPPAAGSARAAAPRRPAAPAAPCAAGCAPPAGNRWCRRPSPAGRARPGAGRRRRPRAA